MKQDIKATLETRVSSKGNEYTCVVIKITDKIEKLVFLSESELELIRINNSKTAIPFGK